MSNSLAPPPMAAPQTERTPSFSDLRTSPSSRSLMLGAQTMDDAISYRSSRSNLSSSIFSSVTRSANSKSIKFFNMRQEKEVAKQKLVNGLRKEKREEYKSFFVQFDSFLFDKCELADRLFSLSILYINALIHYEKNLLVDTIQKSDTSKQDVEQSKQEVIDRLMELSFCYSQILQRHTFRREGVLMFRDTVSEQLFYECLYKMVSLITVGQFENEKLQSIIEAEIARLFRTPSFSLTKEDRKEIRMFIPSEKLYHLKHELGIKLPTKKFVKRKVNNAVSARSPLIMSVLPPYNKMSYSKDKGLDRGIENLRLHIPPDVLLNLGVRSSGTGAANKDNDASPGSGVSGSGNGGGGTGSGGGGTTSTKEKSSPASTPPTKSFNYLKLE